MGAISRFYLRSTADEPLIDLMIPLMTLECQALLDFYNSAAISVMSATMLGMMRLADRVDRTEIPLGFLNENT